MNRRGSDVRRRELGGQDPLERQLGVPRPPSPLSWLLSLLRTRSALGLAPSLTPAVVFLPLGAVLGPHALNWISPRLLERLDPVITIALVVLGVFVGIALGREIKSAVRLLVAASLESFVTIASVAAATAYFARRTGIPLHAPLAAVVLALGLSASASSATTADPDLEPAADAGTRVADLDDVLPIVIVAIVLGWLPSSWPFSRWLVPLAPVFVGLVTGLIGWLLFERAESTPERAVFVIGTLGLAGGAAVSLHISPLVVGFVAGSLWTVAPGRADRLVQDDLRKVQHPLVVMLLLAGGALSAPTATAFWLLAPYLLFRLAGKVAGAWLSAPILEINPADLAAYLIPPGVLGVAFALNFRQILPGQAGDAVLATVSMGTAAFELAALFVMPRWRGRGQT
jgi:hypothetical protein